MYPFHQRGWVSHIILGKALFYLDFQIRNHFKLFVAHTLQPLEVFLTKICMIITPGYQHLRLKTVVHILYIVGRTADSGERVVARSEIRHLILIYLKLRGKGWAVVIQHCKYPEIAPVHLSRTKSSLVSANRAGCVLPKKGEWQLSNIWQLGTQNCCNGGNENFEKETYIL